MTEQPDDANLAFTVSTVWREERVSCPHPDILNAHLAGALAEAASRFVAFHLDESQCPYCSAVVEELQSEDDARAAHADLDAVRTRLLRSTFVELRRAAD